MSAINGVLKKAKDDCKRKAVDLCKKTINSVRNNVTTVRNDIYNSLTKFGAEAKTFCGETAESSWETVKSYGGITKEFCINMYTSVTNWGEGMHTHVIDACKKVACTSGNFLWDLGCRTLCFGYSGLLTFTRCHHFAMCGLLRIVADCVQGLIDGFKILYGTFFDCAKEIFNEITDLFKNIGIAFIKTAKETAILCYKKIRDLLSNGIWWLLLLLLLAIAIICLYKFSSTDVSQHVYRSKVMFVDTNQQQMLHCIKKVLIVAKYQITRIFGWEIQESGKIIDSFTDVDCVVVKSDDYQYDCYTDFTDFPIQ